MLEPSIELAKHDCFVESLGQAIVSGLRELADRAVEPQDLRWTAAKTAADQFQGGVYQPVQLAKVTGSHESSRPGDQENPAVEPQPQQPVQHIIPHKPVVGERYNFKMTVSH